MQYYLSIRPQPNASTVCSQRFFFVWELKRYYFLLKLKFSGGSLKNMHLHDAAWSSIESARFARGCCVRGTRTQPLICVGCSVHYWVTCAINKGGFEIAFSFVVVDTHLPRSEALA